MNVNFKMENLFANKKFQEKDASYLEYTFTETQLSINSSQPYKGEYELYTDQGNVFLKTNPPLATEDLQVESKGDEVTLTLKFSRRHYAILILV